MLAPSRGALRDYEIVEGTLDDLQTLTKIRRDTIAPPVAPKVPESEVGRIGCRNDLLFRICMKAAHYCDDFDNLLDVAQTRNAEFLPPLSDAEVMKVARSAWSYTERGQNRFGQTGAWLPQSTVNGLARDPPLFTLIGWLKAANGPNAEFLVADGLCAPKYLGWPIDRLRQARRRAIETGWIVKMRHEAKGVAALYRWGPASRGEGVSGG